MKTQTDDCRPRGRLRSDLRGAVLLAVLAALGACAGPTGNIAPDRVAAAHAAAPIAPSLAAAAQALRAGAAPAAYARGLVRADAAGRLQVVVRVDRVDAALLDALRQAGLQQPEAVASMRQVQGWVAPAQLAVLARVPGVIAIEPPRYAVTR
jgi:hypothetical protein